MNRALDGLPPEVVEALDRLDANIYDPDCRGARDAATIRAHIDALAAERDAAKAQALDFSEAMRIAIQNELKAEAERDALAQRCAAAERDAVRYRWIVANAMVETDQWVYWHDEPECTHIDKRIDAALTGEQP